MEKIYSAIVAGVLMASSVSGVYAQTAPRYEVQSAIPAFRKMSEIPPTAVSVPTVVEMPFSAGHLERHIFMLINGLTGKPEAVSYKNESAQRAPLSAQVGNTDSPATALVDNDLRTSILFPVSEDPATNVAVITLSSATPITSSQLFIALDNNVALPHKIEVRTMTGAGDKNEDLMGNIVVAQKALQSSNVLFPKTISDYWQVTLWYSQPLRIVELQLGQEELPSTQRANVRFLAQPNAPYTLYFDADRNVTTPHVESGDLTSDKGVVRISEAPTGQNPLYVVADGDRDGVADLNDNCISLANTDQLDVNTNGLGDACDDFDRDGVSNSRDNCINEPNRDQADIDGDMKGDACDDDESRVTEKYPWLPWVGMGSAAVVLIVLFAVTARSLRRPTDTA